MDNYLPRIADYEIETYLSIFGAILVQGPKWCGKTTTSEQHSKSHFYLADPNGNFQNKKLAEMSPQIILEGATPRLVDEWQDVPALWDAVKFLVDKKNTKGAYILTGSSVPPQFKTFHSGNNRIGKIKMFPMSLWESGDSNGAVSFKDLFSDISISGENNLDLKKIISLSVRGGWPGNLNVEKNKQTILPKSYIGYLVSEDISKYDGVKRSSVVGKKILKAVARNNQTLVSKKTLIQDTANITEPTFNLYFDVFENLFVFDNIPAWSPNFRSRVRLRAAPKIRFIDPSLAIAALGLTQDKLLNDLETFGFMFENLCSRDIKIFAQNLGAEVFHYRESLNSNEKESEIDLIVELSDGSWGAFEIKLGANQIEEAEQNLLRIKDKLVRAGAEEPKCMCVISGLSNFAYTTESGVKVVPIGCLRE